MAIQINGSGTISGLSVGGISNTKAVATAAMPAGSVLQVKSTTKTDSTTQSLASDSWWNYTDASLRATITPIAANSIILLSAQIYFGEGSGQWYQFKFMKNGTTDITDVIGDAASDRNRVTAMMDKSTHDDNARPVNLQAVTTAGDTNERYYNIALNHTSGLTRTLSLNQCANDIDNWEYARGISTITAMEIAV